MSFATQTRERSAPVLPLAGMVDVLFLLLIFFMTASVFRDAELAVDVSLPESNSAAAEVGPGTQVVITIDEADRVFLGERQVQLEELPAILEDLKGVIDRDSVVVRGDRAASYGVPFAVLDMVKFAGLGEVSLGTVRPLEE
ncbi:MAG: biopolymer transporter ExbD [Planctomycetota bacterium]